MGLALTPFSKSGFMDFNQKKRKTSKSQRGLCCTFEYYEVDGV
jgi:hypothetical protein